MSRKVKGTIPSILGLWFDKAKESEDKTDSAMVRKAIKTYLSQKYGKEKIKVPPGD